MMLAAAGQAMAGWAALLGGMVLSFLYSGLETGTYTVNKIRLELRAESGGRAARRLRAMLATPGTPLTVVLVGNNLANYLASAGMVLILTSRQVGHTEAWSAAMLTPLIFVFCEVLPKNLFHRHGETLTYLFCWFLELSRRLFTAVGLVGLIRGLVWAILRIGGRRMAAGGSPLEARSGHIAGLLAEGQASGAITQTQSVIAERVVNLGRVSLGQAMVPLDRAVLVDANVTTDQVRELLRSHGHPRFGVYSQSRDNVVGALNAYDVLMDESGSPPSAHVTPAVRLPAHAGIIEALVTLQKRREGMAFVTSEQGRCVGLVTVKDLVEEIVGELEEW
jgi:putative hemolysin